jgi:hypothetical protein
MDPNELDELGGYRLLTSESSESDSGVWGVRIYVRGAREELSDVDRMRVSAGRKMVMDAIQEDAARASAKIAASAADVIARFRQLFKAADLNPVCIEPIPNGYWPTSGEYAEVRLANPWAIVTSELGRVRMGPRKNVMDINWSDSLVTADAPTLFTDRAATTGGAGQRWLHAWNEVEIVNVLRTLAGHVVKPSPLPGAKASR